MSLITPAHGDGATSSRARHPRSVSWFARALRTLAVFLVALAGLLAAPPDASAQTEVPADWSLIPTELGAGDSFRLLFIPTIGRDASSADIEVYNTWVQARAAAGHADIQAYSDTFRMLGSTEAVDARDNTSTTGAGFPIYWLNGAKVADDYADLYDGSWDEEVAGRRETGVEVTLGSSWEIWTGSAQDGTELLNSSDSTSRALGNAGNRWVAVGRPASSTASHGPISGSTADRTGEKGVYALSGVFTVATPPVTPPVVTTPQTTIWEATLAVGEFIYGDEAAATGFRVGVGGTLSDTDFEYDGVTYTFDTIARFPSDDSFAIVFAGCCTVLPDESDAWVLQVDDSPIAFFKDLTARSFPGVYTGSNPPDWQDGDTVVIKITEPAAPPTVTSVDFTSTNTIYAIGDAVEATVTFSAGVDITGTAQLELDFAGTPKPAACGAATNTTTMLCSYTVVMGDTAPNGIAIAANKLTLTGGTITATGSTTDNAVLAHAAVAIDAAHKVDGIRPTLVSATVAADGASIDLAFDEPFSLTSAALVAVTRFSVTADGSTVTVGELVFRDEGGRVYRTLRLQNLSPTITHGQAVIVSYADLTIGDDTRAVIQDLAGNDVASFTTGSGGVTTAPTVTSVDLTSTATTTTYAIGDEVEATVTFSEAVDITGTAQLELDFAGTPKPAACTAATNTTTMVCSYTVEAGDSAPNGIAIAANKLTLDGGTIYATGSTTTTAVLAHAAVAIDAAHKVDGIRPTLVTTGADAPTTSTDGTKVILTFSEDISSVDRTRITIMAGGNVDERGERGWNHGRTRPDDGPDRHDHEPHRGAQRRRRRRRRWQRQPRRAGDLRDQRRRHHHRPHGDLRRSHLHRPPPPPTPSATRSRRR